MAYLACPECQEGPLIVDIDYKLKTMQKENRHTDTKNYCSITSKTTYLVTRCKQECGFEYNFRFNVKDFMCSGGDVDLEVFQLLDEVKGIITYTNKYKKRGKK